MADTGVATITKLKADGKPTGDPPLLVQFNPQKLRLSYATSNASNEGPGHQNVQNAGTGSATLTLDLEFDSADEGTTEAPVSVRSKTNPFEQLILPEPGGAKEKSKPPKIQFSWGDIILVGFMEGLSVDFDLFASNGYPLRAKLSFTVKSQDAKQELSEVAGPGSNAPPAPGAPGMGAVGGVGLGRSAALGAGTGIGLSAGVGLGASLSAGVSLGGQTALAIGGESAAEFAARVGLDPQAWRAVAAGQVDGTLSIDAGAEISFDASFSAAAGIGVTAGVEAQMGGSVEASFGITTSPPGATAGQGGPGFALSAAGGLGAALQTVEIVGAASAAAATRRGFDAPEPAPPPSPATGAPAGTRSPAAQGLAAVPPATRDAATRNLPGVTPPRPDAPPQPRTPLARGGLPAPGASGGTPAPPPPMPDPRASSFGLGVPLRPRVGGAALGQLPGAEPGLILLRPRPLVDGALPADDPRAPPWTVLSRVPARPAARAARCGCGCGCGRCGGAP
jgi:hypothetical protein